MLTINESIAISKARYDILKERINYYSHKYWYSLKYTIAYLSIFDRIEKSKIKNIRNNVQKDYLAWQYRLKTDRNFAYVLLQNTIVDLSYRTGQSILPDKFLINLTDSIIKELLVFQNFVSVQPMTGPVGLNYLLRNDYTTKETGDNQLYLSVEKHTVEAYTRQLSAKINGTATDLMLCFGEDNEQELLQILSKQISYEILECEILNKIDEYSENQTIDLSGIVSFSEEGKRVFYELNRASMKIAGETRRGRGNVIIASTNLIALLQATLPVFKLESVNDLRVGSCVTYVGKLAHYKVFVDPYMRDYTAYVLYKGAGVIDGGLAISPYVLNSAVSEFNETTFEPSTTFKYRGGFTENRTDLVSPEQYYKKLTFKFEEKNDSK